MSGAFFAMLDQHRAHFQHGPIDLIIEAQGDAAAVREAHARARRRFDGLLESLVAELPLLRSDVRQARALRGAVAQRMLKACWPHRDGFITPMAAVAGAVADEMLATLQAPGIRKAYVNNGGDIALHLAAGESFTVGVAEGLARLAGDIRVTAASGIRGIGGGRIGRDDDRQRRQYRGCGHRTPVCIGAKGRQRSWRAPRHC